MEGGMAVWRNGGVAYRSTITFHSGSLRDGIHYMAAREAGIEIGRHGQRKQRTKGSDPPCSKINN